MNLLEVRDVVRFEIDDPVKSAEASDLLRWSRARLCEEIFRAADFVAQEFKHIQGTKTWDTVVGTNYYAFEASDYFLGYPGAIAAIWYSDGSNWNELPVERYVDIKQFQRLSKNSSNGTPIDFWTLWNQRLYVYPAPNYAGTSNLEAYIYKKQTELATDGTADTTELGGDTILHPLVALKAAMEIARRDKAIDLFAAIEAKYTREYRRQKAHYAPKFAGPQFTRFRDF